VCAPVNSVAVLVEASRGATPSETTPLVLPDAGVANVNAQVDDLMTMGVLRRVLAFNVDEHNRVLPTRRFSDTRQTRCTLALETACRQT